MRPGNKKGLTGLDSPHQSLIYWAGITSAAFPTYPTANLDDVSDINDVRRCTIFEALKM